MSAESEHPNNVERPWPFDLSRYDRRMSLNKKEKRGLAAATSGGKPCIGPYRDLLDRLSVIARVQAEIARIGYAPAINEKRIPNLLCKLLLANHSPRLEDLTSERLEELQNDWGNLSNKEDVLALSRALYNFGIIDRPLRQRRSRRPADQATTGVPALWTEWITRWRNTSSGKNWRMVGAQSSAR